ncbi:MAG: hypothetical protein ABSG74_06270 [Candidatus Bathyarchaeia archaeon]
MAETKHMKFSGIANSKDDQLRDFLAKVSLEWEKRFAVAPKVTGDLAEYDAAKLKGTSLSIGKGRDVSDTAVKKGVDFRYGNKGYQVKSNRPSGKQGSPVTLVQKAKNYNWDKLIWILYDRNYNIKEAWEHSRNSYRKRFENKKRLSPDDMRLGHRLK